jgi:ABC-type glutathione transport system ATPase component
MTIETEHAPASAVDRGEPILSVRNLVKEFPIRSRGLLPKTVGAVHAVSDVSFDLYPGETLGLVGESGCGKSTTSRAADPAAAARHQRHGGVRGPDMTHARQGARCVPAPRHADRLPGPVRLAQPAASPSARSSASR